METKAKAKTKDQHTATRPQAELIVLGTGFAMATHCYNTCFAIRNGEEYLLVDAGGGNGIMVQLEKAGIPYQGIHQMFVTHGHTDHVMGVVWMIRRIASEMGKGTYTGHFTIYCHHELAGMICELCRLIPLPDESIRFLGDRIIIRGVTDGENIILAGMDVCFFDIGSTKLKQFGLRAALPDGQSLVCLGDEPYNDICRWYVENCDWLLSEAFCLYSEREVYKPYEKHHSTALDAAQIAEELCAKRLVLYHTEDKSLTTRKVRYTEEARSVFAGEVFVPDDLERIVLDAG